MFINWGKQINEYVDWYPTKKHNYINVSFQCFGIIFEIIFYAERVEASCL